MTPNRSSIATGATATGAGAASGALLPLGLTHVLIGLAVVVAALGALLVAAVRLRIVEPSRLPAAKRSGDGR